MKQHSVWSSCQGFEGERRPREESKRKPAPKLSRTELHLKCVSSGYMTASPLPLSSAPFRWGHRRSSLEGGRKAPLIDAQPQPSSANPELSCLCLMEAPGSRPPRLAEPGFLRLGHCTHSSSKPGPRDLQAAGPLCLSGSSGSALHFSLT